MGDMAEAEPSSCGEAQFPGPLSLWKDLVMPIEPAGEGASAAPEGLGKLLCAALLALLLPPKTLEPNDR